MAVQGVHELRIHLHDRFQEIVKILLAVSGGIDSMYMAERSLRGDLSSSYAAAGAGGGCEFAVAHCNFGLRGAESDGDEKFVREWCEARGVRLYVRRFETADHAAREGISIEMAARDLRYGWFGQLCSDEGFEAVAVAHNADDNAETLMLNLLRGCGSRGLRGMSADSGEFPRRILRPLLADSRAEIRAWMEGEGLSWREDSTNADTVFKRNKLRGKVMPVFAEINPSYLRTLAADMERFAQVDDIAEDYFRQAAAECVLPDGAIDLKKVVTYKHWEYLLFRFTEGRLNADGLLRLKKSVESGRPLGGKIFGPYKVRKGKLRLI